jgi:hypothetical protein
MFGDTGLKQQQAAACFVLSFLGRGTVTASILKGVLIPFG